MRIPIAKPVFNGNEKKYLTECIDTGWVSANGRFVEEFEKEFAEFCGCKYAISCSNGTVSLHLILKSMGIEEGDEVIVPSLTYIATANAVTYCGAKVVFVDSDNETFNIDPSEVEKKITDKTKAIMPVHLYGLPSDMGALMKISEKYNIPIIEDAAEAHGAEYLGKKVGSFGLASSFSFFGNKLITSGEGGMIVTNDEELYKRMKLLKGQAVSPEKKYWHIDVGYNYRMTNMQAAVGLGQLEKIDWHIEQRNRVAKLYEDNLNEVRDYIRFQKVPERCKSVYWMNTIVLEDCVESDREDIMKKMEEHGIEMRPMFYPAHIMPPYYDEREHYSVAEKLGQRGISLPSHATLRDDDVKYICDCLKEVLTTG